VTPPCARTTTSGHPSTTTRTPVPRRPGSTPWPPTCGPRWPTWHGSRSSPPTYRLDELAPGAVVFLGDNQLTPAWETRLFHHDGDTYEARELPDGSTHEILENYFTADDLRAMVAPYGTDVRLTMGDWWWWLTYQVR